MEAMARNLSSVELNNSGVAFVQSGRPQEAMQLFQLALANLRDQFMESGSGGSGSNNNRSGRVERPVEPEPMNHGTTTTTTIKQSLLAPSEDEACLEKPSIASMNVWSIPIRIPASSDSSCSSFLSLYDRALLVDPADVGGDDDIDSDDAHRDATLSAVILFNMALLHHVRGLESGTTEYLERASRLYHIALDVLHRHSSTQACPLDTGMGMGVSSSNELLRLALYNNLAQIDSHLYRMDEMKESLQNMRTILAAVDVNDVHVCHDDMAFMDEDDYLIFSLNAMYYGNEQEFSVAPAA